MKKNERICVRYVTKISTFLSAQLNEPLEENASVQAIGTDCAVELVSAFLLPDHSNIDALRHKTKANSVALT
jgi:hypothetical protein